jgi:nucleotide-binding universal stress UspA family protein
MPTVSAPTRIKLKNILFATDFTPSAQFALSYACNLAHAYDAEVYSVNVLPHLVFVEGVQPDPEQTRFSAEQQLAALVGSESFKGIRHEELIMQGEVAEVLAKLVRNYEIDLIVIGTSGRKGLQKFLMGSVAEDVFRNAQCPVLTVGPHTPNCPADGKVRHILYATDFGPESVHGLPYAISLAEENRARLTLLHVAPELVEALPEPEPGTLPVLDGDEVTASTEKQLRALIPDGAQLWHEPEYMVQFGPPAETIVNVAAQRADIIVLGVKRPTVLTKHLGAGVAYRVACDATCPVLSVGARFRV